jgi:hypothetical protein
MARCSRELSRQLWRPAIHAEGIPFNVLCALIGKFRTWQAEYLGKVGVPASQVDWDFLAAVAACKTLLLAHLLMVANFLFLRWARCDIPCDVDYPVPGSAGVWPAGNKRDQAVWIQPRRPSSCSPICCHRGASAERGPNRCITYRRLSTYPFIPPSILMM